MLPKLSATEENASKKSKCSDDSQSKWEKSQPSSFFTNSPIDLEKRVEVTEPRVNVSNLSEAIIRHNFKDLA